MVKYTNKMMKRFECLELILYCFAFLSLQSCYGVNEKTSIIHSFANIHNRLSTEPNVLTE